MIDTTTNLAEVREEFVAQWGVMGAQWGINRTMAQIHALLMTSAKPLSTDEVMEALEISRGNAHTNLKDLVGWGLVRIITKKGERKEFFESEKGVWEMFRRIAIERKRREIDPALAVLQRCKEETKDMTGKDAEIFHEQMKELEEFVSFASKMADRVAAMQHGKAMQLAFKLFG
ncbi:HTH domain-containing protein [bacterium]|nr:HTH domain-containing protein [Akkermansiaceae bacterium]MDB4311720.1 HTH domain-containing protein [bacterium]MDB4313091.1 HTH domain-containing protein [Akkermansiaceae bacterium]MDB4317508.1 HTH domain-containing protein [bacterium]MDB4381696.1 HTH domain-containing protein [Akkermansiaceae bacterium]